jgi:hypothetical protein
VAVELGFIHPIGDAVEVGEKVYLTAIGFVVRFSPAEQVVAPWDEPFPECRGAAR